MIDPVFALPAIVFVLVAINEYRDWKYPVLCLYCGKRVPIGSLDARMWGTAHNSCLIAHVIAKRMEEE